jgi:hypothetical protein
VFLSRGSAKPGRALALHLAGAHRLNAACNNATAGNTNEQMAHAIRMKPLSTHTVWVVDCMGGLCSKLQPGDTATKATDGTVSSQRCRKDARLAQPETRHTRGQEVFTQEVFIQEKVCTQAVFTQVVLPLPSMIAPTTTVAMPHKSSGRKNVAGLTALG